MKKLLSLLLALLMLSVSLLAFVSCNDAKTDGEINVTTLNGTTGFGMAPLMKENSQGTTSNKYNFEVQTDPSVVLAGLINGSIDIAALPKQMAVFKLSLSIH